MTDYAGLRRAQKIPVTVAVEVRPTTDPGGSRAVLIQLPDAWITTNAAGARLIAAELLRVAEEVDAS